MVCGFVLGHHSSVVFSILQVSCLHKKGQLCRSWPFWNGSCRGDMQWYLNVKGKKSKYKKVLQCESIQVNSPFCVINKNSIRGCRGASSDTIFINHTSLVLQTPIFFVNDRSQVSSPQLWKGLRSWIQDFQEIASGALSQNPQSLLVASDAKLLLHLASFLLTGNICLLNSIFKSL